MDEIHAWHQPFVDIALLFALLVIVIKLLLK